jgi:hypothetical protein
MNRPDLGFPGGRHLTSNGNTDLLPMALDATIVGATFSWKLNDLPEVPARKRRGGDVLRRMRFSPGPCLHSLWHSNLADC